jgi:curved DNA-binding protein
MQQVTAYQFLGVAESATQKQIDDAWKRLMKQYHPDLNPGVDLRITQKLNEAHDQISDSEKRKRYDAYLAHLRQPPVQRQPQVWVVNMNASGVTSTTININISWGPGSSQWS